MLKLKEPIQLKTGLRLAAASESFCQRLTGNYGLMTAQVAPKDLLFLLTAPPELPEDLGGGASLSLANSFTDIRQVTVDVVNNVVNRILLDGRSSFTYQDQVYITTVLRKLGVTDVSRFMEEVRRLREEQRSQTELTRLYRQEVTQKALAALAASEEKGGKGAGPEGREEIPAVPAPRYYLHQDIYRRLETGDIYQEVTAFQQNLTTLGDVIENNELRLSEQLRLSRSLHLEELKRRNLYGGAVTLRHHINRYEQGEFLPPPANEPQVLAQAAEAALLSMVDQVVTHTLERRTAWREPWLNLSQSLSQTAENTLNRFETYHSQITNRQQMGTEYSAWYQTLAKEEVNWLRRLTESWHSRELLTREALPGRMGEPGVSSVPLERRESVGAEGGEFPGQVPPEQEPGMSTRELTSLTREILRRGQQRQETLRPQAFEHIQTETVRERTIRQETELRHLSVQAVRALRELSALEMEMTVLEQQAVPLTAAPPSLPEPGRPATLRETLSTLRRETERHTLETLRERGGDIPPSPQELLVPPAEDGGGEMAATRVSVPAEHADPALLERELREIDRQNRERYERIQATQRQRTREVIVHPPDQRRTMTDALRAIDQPEQVIRELIEARQAQTAPAVPPQVERVLQQADPISRQVYEALLRYQADPAAAIAEGLVRPGNLGAFNVEAARREAQAAAMEHPASRARERPMEQSPPMPDGEALLTPLRELPQRTPPPRRNPGEWGKAPIVFKREDYSAIEELVERLEERRVQSGVQQVTQEAVTHQSVTQTEITDQTRQVVAQTTEDITALVNRTMARQMNAITDKVYRQMERKLQTERSRRGRF